jgi:hypothetical protein
VLIIERQSIRGRTYVDELDPELSMLTLDRDVRVYRRHGRQTVHVIMP